LALVLTVYEAKGLEFDDVLLYNFFTDSEVLNSYPFSAFFLNVLILRVIYLAFQLGKDSQFPLKTGSFITVENRLRVL